MKLFVGLGNIGQEYSWSRHNMGFLIIDSYLNKENITRPSEKNQNYLLYKYYKNSENIFFLKPLTFMNNSGIAVKEVLQKYQISINDLLVISDDFNLPFGKIRIRTSGSAGGHNGLKSICKALNTNEYNRLRVGIGAPDNIENSRNYVLSNFSSSEKKLLPDLFAVTNEIIDSLITTDINKIMSKFNNRNFEF